MQYQKLKISPSTPPNVRELINQLENHYFQAVHCMLQLPLSKDDPTIGCGFAIAQVLMAAVSGISVTLYTPCTPVGKKGNRGKIFKELLIKYYPWDLEPKNTMTPAEAAGVIYNVFRNPLTHDLGLNLDKKATTDKEKIKRKQSLSKSEDKIKDLETSNRPPSMPPAVTKRRDATVLLGEALYWGVRRMVEKLSANEICMQAAENFLKQHFHLSKE